MLSLPGGSDIDSASDPNRYRYMIISGPHGESPTTFLLSELQTLRSRGWVDQQAWVLRGLEARVHPASPAAHGATVELDHRVHDGPIYVAMDAVYRHTDLAQLTDGDPRYPYTRKIATVLDSGMPVLDVQLANGTATRSN